MSEEVRLPEGTLDLRAELVPAVRALLRRGLDDAFMASCVRIGAFQSFGGGLKARLVGGVRVDVDAALKLGDAELELHRRLMERVNAERAATFPAVLDLVKLDAQRRLLMMEQLRKHETLLEWIYKRPTPLGEIDRVLDKVLEAVRAIRRAGAGPRLPGVAVTPDPYGERIRTRVRAIVAADPSLAPLRDRAGTVDGIPCPPLAELLPALGRWLRGSLSAVRPRLTHGDLHLGNIMVRRRGAGLSVRLIDPNPLIGYADPLYDAGKLLHWAEPVGWARIAPDACRFRSSLPKRGPWHLATRVHDVPRAAEERREHLEQEARARIAAAARAGDPTRAARLEVSIAAAHVGLAGLLTRPEDADLRRFVFAHALAALARWSAATEPDRRPT